MILSEKTIARFFPYYVTLTEEQKRRVLCRTLLFVVIAALVLASFTGILYATRDRDSVNWQTHLRGEPQAEKDIELINKNAVHVLCGTFVDNIYDINLATGTYKLNMYAWFRWDGSPELDMANHFRIYNCDIEYKDIVKRYQTGNTNYQLVRFSGQVANQFRTAGFPLDSHQFFIYLEPDYSAKYVMLVPDKPESGVNRNLVISGYKFTRSAVESIAYEHKNVRGDVRLLRGKNVASELVTAVEIERNGIGLYIKCFIGLFGCLLWIIIVLFINIYHRVNVLGMIPGSLFGCIANIMVGASLVPDALEMGLLEYVNIWAY